MNTRQLFQQIFVFIIFISFWKILIYSTSIKEFILPQPETIFKTYISMASDGLLWKHTFVTLEETLAGFIIGSIIGIFLGYLIGKSEVIERTISPYVIALQTVPIIAIAPLIIIWFGFGIESKIIICTLIVFFPILVNTISGMNAIDDKKVDLFKTSGASKSQIFFKLEIPSIAPMLFAGFKIGITLAVIGAVVGEFVGSSSGLGYLVMQASGLMNMPKVFAALLQLAIMGLLLYSLVSLLERSLVPWSASKNKQQRS